MLKRITGTRTPHILGNLAIVYVAIGMPLAHPALHEHAAHDHCCTGHRVDHFETADGKQEEHFCPICDFLASYPFRQNISALLLEKNGPLIGTAPLVALFTDKTSSRPGEPRAPPPSHRVS